MGSLEGMAGKGLVLALDTTSPERSIAITEQELLVAEWGIRSAQTHSRAIHQEIDWLLRKANVDWGCIGLISACAGPGSFTGLRVSLATAKGLAQPLGVPLIPISSLAAMAHASGLPGTVGVIRDALRGDVYVQRFEVSVGRRVRELATPELLALADGWESLAGTCQWIVNGLPEDSTAEHLATRSTYRLPTPFLAASVAVLGWRTWLAGDHQSADLADGYYVRASDAELHRK